MIIGDYKNLGRLNNLVKKIDEEGNSNRARHLVRNLNKAYIEGNLDLDLMLGASDKVGGIRKTLEYLNLDEEERKEYSFDELYSGWGLYDKIHHGNHSGDFALRHAILGDDTKLSGLGAEDDHKSFLIRSKLFDTGIWRDGVGPLFRDYLKNRVIDEDMRDDEYFEKVRDVFHELNGLYYYGNRFNRVKDILSECSDLKEPEKVFVLDSLEKWRERDQEFLMVKSFTDSLYKNGFSTEDIMKKLSE